MKRLALWVGLTMLPACCVFAKANHVDPTSRLTTVETLEAETVALVHFVDKDHNEIAPDSDKPGELKAYCTGVWVNSDTFLSAEHCVDDIGRPSDVTLPLEELLHALNSDVPVVRAWTPMNQPVMYSGYGDIDPKHKTYHTGRVVAVDMKQDLVLIRADASGAHPYAHIARGPIHDGQEVHVVGHPAGLWWTYCHGYVSSRRPQYVDEQGVHDMLQVSAPVFFGNSGGGAFDADGNLIGMADAIRVGVPDVTFFIHRDTLRAFMEHERVIPPETTKPQ
jgi:S1-C subfamily serine protease